MDLARTPKRKELVNSRLLKDYASWIYCEGCNKTVAYLCYVTYDLFDFEYTCLCGNRGEVHIEFDRDSDFQTSDEPLLPIKNRLCCPADGSPLVTFVDKNLESFKCDIVCKGCGTLYSVGL